MIKKDARRGETKIKFVAILINEKREKLYNIILIN